MAKLQATDGFQLSEIQLRLLRWALYLHSRSLLLLGKVRLSDNLDIKPKPLRYQFKTSVMAGSLADVDG